MSIFDHFASKETGRPVRKTASPVSYRRRFADLDDACAEALEQYPEDRETVESFVWSLKETCKARYKKALDSPDPLNAAPCFYLSRDRMCAYACLLPPENGGGEITLEDFLGDLHYEGIQAGVLDSEIPREFALGYLHIFPVARGKPPQPGEDGKITELFQRRKHMSLEVQNGSQADFARDIQLQPIRKGSVICLIRPPRRGIDGKDVTGQVLPSPTAAAIEIPQGENTAISRGGQALTAGADGILYIKDDRFCIHAQKIIDGNLDQFQGVLRVSGNLYVGGNVDGGVEVEASGDIVVNGKLGRARLSSTGGTIRIQQGIHGTEGHTFVTAASQVQAPEIEQAEVSAGTSVIAETVSNSSIRCGGTVYVMSGRGMIVDSAILAGDSILCLRIGNLAGGRSRFSVGYPPHIPESWRRARTELAEVQATVEKLWEPITDLRKKGSRISDSEKLLLERLVEQRNLYIEKREALTTELKALNKLLDKRSKGIIRCEKLHPFLNVQIGRLTEEITTIEEACSIHADENRIVLK